MKRGWLALLLSALPIAALADTTTGDGTSTAKLLANLFQGCWACGAFNTIGAIGLNLADKVFAQLASGMTILIGLFMALWVLHFAARLFLPFGPPAASHWNMGATKLMKLIFVLAFLQTSGPFWNYIFTPIMSTGLGLASQMATATDSYETLFGSSAGVPSGVTDYCSGTIPDTKVTGLSDSAKQGLTALEQMDCPMSKIQSQFGKGIMIGVAVIGQMGCEKSWLPNIVPSSGAVAFLAAGIILIGVFLWGFLIFPFLLIDVLARVILVAATSPVAIAAILFKPTARIAERAVWSLLQAGLTLMFGATIAGIGKALVAYILQEMSSGSGAPALTDWTSLDSTLENACSKGFNVDFSTASFYMLVGTGIITIFMMRKAASLAAELTGISGNVGAQAGMAAIMGAAAGAAGRVAQATYTQFTQGAKSSKAAEVAGTGGTNKR